MKSFFKNHGPFDLKFLLQKIQFSNIKNYPDLKVLSVATLDEAENNDLSFFENIKYESSLHKSKASCVLINKKNLNLLKKKNILALVSENPLLDFILIAKIFYPDSDTDNNDIDLDNKYENFLKKNIIIDKSVKLGKNIKIGANSTIKKNVIIGDNVRIGSNCSISNAIIHENVIINDGTVIGKIGYGFKFINGKLNFIPHIGSVIIKKSVYIGSNCTIDRGSFTNTVIGNETMLDNQVHVAHNCKIGSHCFIAGQVGIAGSSIIGNNCMIGGQAGISGHLSIGDNVYIGGGSGVLQDICSGKKIMGYPARDMRNFIKKKKND